MKTIIPNLKWISTLLLFMTCSLMVSQNDKERKFTTNKIDVTVKDNSGNNHFLVFNKTISEDKSSTAYNVEFWVNNMVIINPDKISKISFKDGVKTYTGSYYKSNADLYNAESQVLYFYIEESNIKSLEDFHPSMVRLTMSDGDFYDYRFAAVDNFKKAVKEIIETGK